MYISVFVYMYTFTAWTSYTQTGLVLIHTNATINQLNQLCSSGVCISLYVYIYILPINIYVYMCIYIYIYVYRLSAHTDKCRN